MIARIERALVLGFIGGVCLSLSWLAAHAPTLVDWLGWGLGGVAWGYFWSCALVRRRYMLPL